jgi:hypothetical protein
LPTNLIVPNGTAIAFLHVDAPWDTPNLHTIELQDCTERVVYSTDQLDYTLSSKLIVLLPQELTIDKSYDTKEAKITVLENETSSGNLILEGFYTPTNQVENTEDNDGGPIPVRFNITKKHLTRRDLIYSVNTTLHMLHVIMFWRILA